MLITLLSLLLHFAMIVVPHPGVVDNGGSGGHRDGDLLLLATELGHPGTTANTCTRCMIKGGDPDETGILPWRLEVLEVVGINDGLDGCDKSDSHNATN